MPAYFDTGFSVRQPAWHGKATVLDDYPTDWQDARVKAGLTWEPVIVPTATPVQVNLGFGQTIQTWGEDAAHKAIARSDTGAILGSGVGPNFTPVPNGVLGEIAEALLDSGSTVRFETAGSCRGGAEVWALLYLDEPVRVAGDNSETLPFIAIMNAHDGSGSFRINPTSVRVVCWNTVQAATAQGKAIGRQFTFRHTGSVMDRIEDAKKALAGLRDETAEWVEMANSLAVLNVTDVQVEKFLSEFIPQPEAQVISDRVQTNIDKARSLFRSTYLDSVTCEAHRGTALGLVDAGIEYLDHLRGFRNTDTYLGRTILRPEPAKAKLVTLARKAATF